MKTSKEYQSIVDKYIANNSPIVQEKKNFIAPDKDASDIDTNRVLSRKKDEYIPSSNEVFDRVSTSERLSVQIYKASLALIGEIGGNSIKTL
jgi:hypothetical protein